MTTKDVTETDAAFTGNKLLSTLSSEARALLEPHGTLVELQAGETALTRGEQVTQTLFPMGPTLISLEIELPTRHWLHFWAEVVDEANEIGFAVKFNSASDEDQHMLEEYIAKVLKAAPIK